MAANEAVAPTLARRLKEDTAALHREAERTPLMQALLSGRTTRLHYARLLQQLLPLYAGIEPRMDARTADADAPVWLREAWPPGLARLPALQADLAALSPTPRAPLPATQAYLDRLAVIDTLDAPDARWLAHVYVRHLGDLSGGQMLHNALARALGEAPVLRFHAFGDGDQVARLKSRLRGALATLPAHGPLADAAVDEACLAFAQHLRLFDEIAAQG